MFVIDEKRRALEEMLKGCQGVVDGGARGTSERKNLDVDERPGNNII